MPFQDCTVIVTWAANGATGVTNVAVVIWPWAFVVPLPVTAVVGVHTLGDGISGVTLYT
jgi:hypothetical protein